MAEARSVGMKYVMNVKQLSESSCESNFMSEGYYSEKL